MHWGKPTQIKADNGAPLGNPRSDMPSELALYLIGLGIKVRNNKAFSPWENGHVEKNQDTSGRWVDPAKCQDLNQVQKALDQVIDIHLNKFPVQKLKFQSRAHVFPQLLQQVNKEQQLTLNLEPIGQFLAQGTWTRKVAATGQISIYGNSLYVDSKCKHQYVNVLFDPAKFAWTIFNQKGNFIRSIPADFLSKANILALSISQRTLRAKLKDASGA